MLKTNPDPPEAGKHGFVRPGELGPPRESEIHKLKFPCKKSAGLSIKVLPTFRL
jgi:hypothetical protein